MPIKTLGSLGKIRVGRVTGNTHIFFGLSSVDKSVGLLQGRGFETHQGRVVVSLIKTLHLNCLVLV